MRIFPVIAAVCGIVFVLPSCKTRSALVNLSPRDGAIFKRKKSDLIAAPIQPVVIDTVGTEEQAPVMIGYSMGDVLESNRGATVLASAGTDNRTVRTTAYCHKELDSLPYGMKTADGSTLKFGLIRSAAADWSRYPVGTKFKIQGLPYEYVIDDYGSALVGTDTIDLYKPTFAAMNDWGAREVPIQIVEWGCFDRSKKILAGRLHKTKAHHVHEMHSAITTKRQSKKVPRMALPDSVKKAAAAQAPVEQVLNDASTLPTVNINDREA